jgi:hypothetical protein
MGFEYRARFADPSWYAANRAAVLKHVTELGCRVPTERPSASSSTWNPTESEVWLRDTESERSAGAWPYDVRVFVRDELTVEVTAFNAAYFTGVRALMEWITGHTVAELLDDDGELVGWPVRA